MELSASEKFELENINANNNYIAKLRDNKTSQQVESEENMQHMFANNLNIELFGPKKKPDEPELGFMQKSVPVKKKKFAKYHANAESDINKFAGAYRVDICSADPINLNDYVGKNMI